MYWRPIIDTEPSDGARLAGGPYRFSRFARMARGRATEILPLSAAPPDVLARLTAPRTAPPGLLFDRPQVMGILNVTPDSFSDGGMHDGPKAAIGHAKAMISAGAALLDIGGESTRPGADFVESHIEAERTVPVIQALMKAGIETPISIDTRKADVADKALGAGAILFNDVTALSFDDQSAAVAARHKAFVCLMHASGDPKVMQSRTDYDDVVLDVYDYLAGRIDVALAHGVDRERIIVDPGIGFGKTEAQNLDLIRNLSLFHALGCPILFGASRKRFVGAITGVDKAADRLGGSVAVAIEAARQGAQIIRVHDVAQTRQALDMLDALNG